MPYQFPSRIRYSEIGEDHRLTLSGIINYFQDSSTFQSEELGNGLSLLESRGKAWILSYWHVVINRRPKLGEEILSQTWPIGMRGFLGDRNYRLLDGQGETLAYAESLWAFLDVRVGHLSKIDQDVIDLYKLEEPLPMEKTSRKVPVPEGSEARESFRVRRCHLDTNHHVNNGQYIVLAQEYLPEDFEVHDIRVEYRKAAVLGTEILPLVKLEENRCTVGLCDMEGKPYAVVEFSR